MEKNRIVSEEYSIAATEVLDMLKYFPSEMIDKIPVQLIDFFKEVSIEDYKPEFDYSRTGLKR